MSVWPLDDNLTKAQGDFDNFTKTSKKLTSEQTLIGPVGAGSFERSIQIFQIWPCIMAI